jgi:hypothetical protein
MTVRVVNLPPGMNLDLGAAVTVTDTHPDAVLVFAADHFALEHYRDILVQAAVADLVAWVAYPKGGKLGTDLSRDGLWKLLSPAGIRPVRQVSIDDTWSALQFRPG